MLETLYFRNLPQWTGLLLSASSSSKAMPLNPLLSPFPLLAGVVTEPAFARKLFVTDTALKMMGFLTEFERA